MQQLRDHDVRADEASVEPLVALQNVTKFYRTDSVETRALFGVTLGIKRGEFLSIVGPSGCGKSTLLHVLGLLDSFDIGTYLLHSEDVATLTPKKRAEMRNRHLGFIFQDFNLIGDLTVLENIALPLTYRDSLSRASRLERAEHALAQVGLTHRKSHFPSELSGGEQQRVSIARGVVGQPSMVLADEPTGNLDTTSGNSVIDLLKRLNRLGTTICMVTHDQSFAAAASRQVHMRDGAIVNDDSR